MATEKDPAAVSLGRRGGLARKRSLSPEELSEQARNAVAARWDKATPGNRADVGKKLAQARAKKAAKGKAAAAGKLTAPSKRGGQAGSGEPKAKRAKKRKA